MNGGNEFILVSAPTKAGEAFIEVLKKRGLDFAVLTNSVAEKHRLDKLGVKTFIEVDTKKCDSWMMPDLAIGKVFLFESSLTLCCRYVQICRSWTGKSICVVARGGSSRLIYKAMGANCIVHANEKEVSLLLD